MKYVQEWADFHNSIRFVTLLPLSPKGGCLATKSDLSNALIGFRVRSDLSLQTAIEVGVTRGARILLQIICLRKYIAIMTSYFYKSF